MKNKQIDHTSNTMSKHHGVFTKNFIIFFSNQGKTEHVPAFEFEIFYNIILGRLFKCNIYTVTTATSQLYICYKFDSIKKLSDVQEFHIWHRHLSIQVKHSFIAKSACVLFH